MWIDTYGEVRFITVVDHKLLDFVMDGAVAMATQEAGLWFAWFPLPSMYGCVFVCELVNEIHNVDTHCYYEYKLTYTYYILYARMILYRPGYWVENTGKKV